MANPSKSQIAQAVLDHHGQTFADELDIDFDQGSAALFRMLCAAILFSTRIQNELARSAARALADAGWTTPASLASASFADRVNVLNQSGYARYDESTASTLATTASQLVESYDGDLNNLREQANSDPRTERGALKRFKGLGDVGCDIFFREVQVTWPELFPFADKRALKTADRLGLEADAFGLCELVGSDRYPALVAGLVRTAIARDFDTVLEGAGNAGR